MKNHKSESIEKAVAMTTHQLLQQARARQSFDVGQVPQMRIPKDMTDMPKNKNLLDEQMNYSSPVFRTEKVISGLGFSPNDERVFNSFLDKQMQSKNGVEFRQSLMRKLQEMQAEPPQRQAVMQRAQTLWNNSQKDTQFMNMKKSETFFTIPLDLSTRVMKKSDDECCETEAEEMNETEADELAEDAEDYSLLAPREEDISEQVGFNFSLNGPEYTANGGLSPVKKEVRIATDADLANWLAQNMNKGFGDTGPRDPDEDADDDTDEDADTDNDMTDVDDEDMDKAFRTAIEASDCKKALALLTQDDDNDFEKGAGHKYISRIPKAGGKGYNYIYNEAQAMQMHREGQHNVGTKLKLDGEDGHHQITARHDNGDVTIRHDITGKVDRISAKELHDRMQATHGAKALAHQDRAAAAYKLMAEKGTEKQKALALATLKKRHPDWLGVASSAEKKPEPAWKQKPISPEQQARVKAMFESHKKEEEAKVTRKDIQSTNAELTLNSALDHSQNMMKQDTIEGHEHARKVLADAQENPRISKEDKMKLSLLQKKHFQRAQELKDAPQEAPKADDAAAQAQAESDKYLNDKYNEIRDDKNEYNPDYDMNAAKTELLEHHKKMLDKFPNGPKAKQHQSAIAKLQNEIGSEGFPNGAQNQNSSMAGEKKRLQNIVDAYSNMNSSSAAPVISSYKAHLKLANMENGPKQKAIHQQQADHLYSQLQKIHGYHPEVKKLKFDKISADAKSLLDEGKEHLASTKYEVLVDHARSAFGEDSKEAKQAEKQLKDAKAIVAIKQEEQRAEEAKPREVSLGNGIKYKQLKGSAEDVTKEKVRALHADMHQSDHHAAASDLERTAIGEAGNRKESLKKQAQMHREIARDKTNEGIAKREKEIADAAQKRKDDAAQKKAAEEKKAQEIEAESKQLKAEAKANKTPEQLKKEKEESQPIRHAAKFMSQDLTRYNLQGVKIKNGKAIATDGHRLDIRNTTATKDGMLHDPSKVESHDALNYKTKEEAGQYPDYKQITDPVDKNGKELHSVDEAGRKELISKIDAHIKSEKARLQEKAEAEGKKKTTENTKMIPVNFSDIGIKGGGTVNAAYLKEALSTMNGNVKIQGAKDLNSPIKLSHSGGDHYLMPMRADNEKEQAARKEAYSAPAKTEEKKPEKLSTMEQYKADKAKPAHEHSLDAIGTKATPKMSEYKDAHLKAQESHLSAMDAAKKEGHTELAKMHDQLFNLHGEASNNASSDSPKEIEKRNKQIAAGVKEIKNEQKRVSLQSKVKKSFDAEETITNDLGGWLMKKGIQSMPEGVPDDVEQGEDVNGPMFDLQNYGATNDVSASNETGSENVPTGDQEKLNSDDPDVGGIQDGIPYITTIPEASGQPTDEQISRLTKSMVQRDDAIAANKYAAQAMRKGVAASRVVGLGIPAPQRQQPQRETPQFMQKGDVFYTNASDLAVDEMMKSESANAPTFDFASPLTKSEMCKSCKSQMPQWASVCPNCGIEKCSDGSMKKSLSVESISEIRSPAIRPARVNEIKAPNGIRLPIR